MLSATAKSYIEYLFTIHYYLLPQKNPRNKSEDFLDAGVGFERPQIAFLITIQSLSCSLLRQH